MALIADILLIAGALAAGLYCLVLSRRLRKFNDLEKGVGGAVAVLSAQVDDMTKALERARAAAGASAESLEASTARAEGVRERLEILLAAMHDLPEEGGAEAQRARRVVWRRPHGGAGVGPEVAPASMPAFRHSGARAEVAE